MTATNFDSGYDVNQPENKIKTLAIALAITLAGGVVIALGWVVMWLVCTNLSPDPVRDARYAAIQAAQVEQERIAALGPVKSMLDVEHVAQGKRLYLAGCITCHGTEGRGVETMGGKNLVTSYFSKKRSDNELADFIAAGRTMDDPRNTSKRVMPPRGGRVDYTDQHLADVVAYIRYLQDPRRVVGTIPDVKVAILDTPEPEPVAVNVAATANGQTFDPQRLANGKRGFNSCIACHAKTGLGVPKTGADLVHSDFVKSKSDDELLDFVKKGRTSDDPNSKLKIQMPAKGGNPALKDEQIKDIIVYLRSLQQAAADAK